MNRLRNFPVALEACLLGGFCRVWAGGICRTAARMNAEKSSAGVIERARRVNFPERGGGFVPVELSLYRILIIFVARKVFRGK